eukprot:TRINITY_DN40269_c0_g1_i1.p1 TRINITY_DN40269_c0_g1~~TRINITY_DN40269_c0_g1_i1.p1  ORF type:complete len:404 (+),score=99.66 TRINITY_DN40269_c0_g1_i1:182-1393(+)
MLFAGNVNGIASNTIDILDLSTFVWSHLGSLGNSPTARNSHSAILMPDAEEPDNKANLLIFGGGTGSDVPRAGIDLQDFAVFDPRAMVWKCPAVTTHGEAARTAGGSAPVVPGRAHAAVKVGRSVLFHGGGRNPTNQLSAVLCHALSERQVLRLTNRRNRSLSEEGTVDGDEDVDVGDSPSSGGAFAACAAAGTEQARSTEAWCRMLRSLKWKPVPPLAESGSAPTPRSFHAAVSLAPAGVPVLLIYGGWHPHRGNFGDIWAAKLDPWTFSDDEGRGGGVGKRAKEADSRFQARLSASSGSERRGYFDDDDDDDGDDGPFVNVGGRIMPLRMFAQLLRMQLGEEEGERRLRDLLTQARGAGGQPGGGEDDDDDDEDDEDNLAMEGGEEEDGDSSSDAAMDVYG